LKAAVSGRGVLDRFVLSKAMFLFSEVIHIYDFTNVVAESKQHQALRHELIHPE
jgi:hypothetical protein